MKAKSMFVLFVSLMVVSSVAIGFASMMLTATGKTNIPPSAVTVSIRNFAFSPQNISIAGNTTITWTNNDTVAHTVTSLSGAPVAFDSGTLNPGDSFSYNFSVAGVYPYYCMIHPFMRGNVSAGGVAQGVYVDISNFAFRPDLVTISAGTTVTWTNNDSVAHTVTTLTGAPVAFDSNTLNPGSTFSYTFTQPGTYPYYCKIHPFMMGNVTVTA